MNIKIETKRIILRQFAEDDAAAASHNSSQPIVAHFMSDMVMKTEEAALGWIRWINNKKFDATVPCVVLAVDLKSTRKCIGLIGVAPKRELNNEIEILFEIADEYQNNGYATEAGKAIIWWAFEQAQQDVLSAIVKPENKASRRVIEKLGFVYCDTRILPCDGADCAFDYFKLFHTDYLPSPEWDDNNLYLPENMASFFDKRAPGYNEHMLLDGGINDYIKLGSFIPATQEPFFILDIGCGTGIELSYIWEKAPNAQITCIDLSREMLNLLLEHHQDKTKQITAIQASYFSWEYPEKAFDMVVSSMTMHHFWQDEKVEIYKKIHSTLREGGVYIESDFIVDAPLAEQHRRRYKKILAHISDKALPGEYHIDIPFTVKSQKELLGDSGFTLVEVLDEDINHGNGAILRAVKNSETQIISVREHPEYLDRAVDYFSSKWGIDRKVYEASISDSLTTQNPLPRWYLMFKGNDIIGSFGLIDNDFMIRKDLLPWLCALYVEKTERGKSLGSRLLARGRQEAKALGYDKLYLCTDLVGYYEKYGWRFFGMEESEWGGKTRVYEIESVR
jgi:RimJ/RimL family protein N-acetyltransferase/ubiquinone/menaquinone biosynthesis C-methylase UbiE